MFLIGIAKVLRLNSRLALKMGCV